MRKEVRRALNFQAMVIASQGSEAKAVTAFGQACAEFDTSDDISVEIDRYAELLGVSSRVLTDAYLKCRPAFESIPDDVNVLTWEDGGWPKGTHDSPFCPRFLFTRGNGSLLGRLSIAVLGTRRPSEEGKRLCIETVKTLGKKGIVTASGMALGIEGVSHLAALQNGWPTIAVLGTELGSCYPPEHAKLQEEIAQRGILVSRFSPALTPQKWFLALANRLLCTLASAVVVIEECDGGGAVSQAEFALDAGRPVFLYRSSVDNDALLWPRRLASRSGVVVVDKPGDITRHLFPDKPAEKKPKKILPEQLSLF